MNPTATIRAQLLATEHWSLLATRGTTQSEILSRITTFLMLVSSSPTIERFLVTSANDDDRGLWQTYNHLAGPRVLLQPLASGGTFITFVTSALVSAFGALAATALNAPGLLAAIVAAGCGLVYLFSSIWMGMRQYRRLAHRQVLFPAAGAIDNRRLA